MNSYETNPSLENKGQQKEKWVERVMETQKKYKMTFKNSWWQCLVALILWKPVGTIVIFALVFSHIAISDEDIIRASNLAGFVFALFFSYYLSHSTWKRKQEKLNK